MKIRFYVVLAFVVAAAELIWWYYFKSVPKELLSTTTIEEKHTANKKNEDVPISVSRFDANTSAISASASANDGKFGKKMHAHIPTEDRERWEKYLLRHSYNQQKRAKETTSNAVEDGEQRIVLFVHFHKAGGTSMIKKFKNGGYQFWNYQTNGIPRFLTRSPPEEKSAQQKSQNSLDNTEGGQICSKLKHNSRTTEILKFWRYSRPQFEAFLRDAKGQQSWPYCLPPEPTTDLTPQRRGVEFISLEWNFFRKDHFFETGYLRDQAKIDVITMLRDPYDRFLSNFKFDNPSKNYANPLKWARMDLVRKKGSFKSHLKPTTERRQSPQYQYGEKVADTLRFAVNYNKPNYYTAFLNGMAENTDEDNDSEETSTTRKYDFDYFAFGLNRTHLEVAKQRLNSLFDAVLILERPETHRQLERWFHFLDKTKSENHCLPHKNKNGKRSRYQSFSFTREEFYRYNALDKELYEYALGLSLSKSR